MKKRIISLVLALVMLMSTAVLFAGCGNSKTDALVIMSEELDGLFNPFFSTTAADGTIVSMTQIGMLSSKYVNGKVEVAYGEDEAVVVKDYESKYDSAKNETTYTFVLKNGILYSDGHPLTMEDVLFNLYVYLDPVYTGSNTMYSTKIKGLSNYRLQTVGSGSSNDGDLVDSQARTKASARINELINLFKTNRTPSGSYYADYATMKAAITAHSLSSGYKGAISNNAAEVTNATLLEDYERTLKYFKEELESDYISAQSAYTEEPYKSRSEFKDEILCFMYHEGYVSVEWAKGPDGKDDKSKIENVKLGYNNSAITTKEQAINHVYNDKIASELHIILSLWATATKLHTEYSAKAKEVILHQNTTGDTLKVPSIEGIVSLGHTDKKGSTVTVNGTDYKVASGHNPDGTVSASDEYDVLQITIEGVDPKAVWNFAFAVAPQHYYGEGSKIGVDIANNKFGVEYASFDFMTKIVQSTRNIKVPMGAGAYKATDRNNGDNPDGNEFSKDNVVYFKANTNFELVGTGISNAKIEKIRYQVVSATNAISALESGNVHYITPQLTTENYDKIDRLGSKGIEFILEDQLGYGYIGINAKEVPNLYLRKAIMCAMNTTLALDYYRPGTASQIYWPMSTVSWAYPLDNAGKLSTDNGMDYPQLNGTFSEDVARTNIQKYMEEAGVSAGDPELEITFTIAGSNLQDHPTYKTFRDAQALLNSLGWKVDVVADVQALTKLSTGSLQVWAAAWGSTIDPDMYQVYHKNSSATSTLAWGYPSIKTSGSSEEKAILNELSELIDEARETLDQSKRTETYKKAMSKVLELGIELPVYQRSTIYAYNSKVIDASTLPSQDEMNPYSSPLDRIWELEFAD